MIFLFINLSFLIHETENLFLLSSFCCSHSKTSTSIIHDLIVANKLVCMYAKHQDLGGGYLFFEKTEERNPVSWNVMIGGFAKEGTCSCGDYW